MSSDVQQALEITGFSLCNFKADGNDTCDVCEEEIKIGANVYYNRTSYEYDEGEYYCEQCLLETPARWEKGADAWAIYAEELS